MNEPNGEPTLVLAARRFCCGQSTAGQVMDAFRAANVYVEWLPGLAMPSMDYEGTAWVPVFSTSSRLAAFVAARDDRSDGAVSYVCMSGARIMDRYITNLCERAGIVLDVQDDHRVLAPSARLSEQA